MCIRDSMVASLAGALTALAISMAPNAFAMSEIVMWLNGALTDRSWREVWLATPLVALGVLLLWRSGKSLDALTLGEPVARSLGVEPARLLWLLIVGMGLTVGAGVAVAGIIGFVGLIVPSALAGALLVLVADSVVRILPLVTELRLGIALSLLGAPFFLWLLLRMRRGLA
jgi:iron complex transport system permease protein